MTPQLTSTGAYSVTLPRGSRLPDRCPGCRARLGPWRHYRATPPVLAGARARCPQHHEVVVVEEDR